MTQLRAAFAFSGRLSSRRVVETGHAMAEMAGVKVARVRAGVADGWVVLSAFLEAATADQAQIWLMHTLIELERDDYAELFRVEIDGENRPFQA